LLNSGIPRFKTSPGDSRSQDAATKNELIFGSYYLFEALYILAGKLDPRMI
jgi:hypothetical protein